MFLFYYDFGNAKTVIKIDINCNFIYLTGLIHYLLLSNTFFIILNPTVYNSRINELRYLRSRIHSYRLLYFIESLYFTDSSKSYLELCLFSEIRDERGNWRNLAPTESLPNCLALYLLPLVSTWTYIVNYVRVSVLRRLCRKRWSMSQYVRATRVKWYSFTYIHWLREVDLICSVLLTLNVCRLRGEHFENQ